MADEPIAGELRARRALVCHPGTGDYWRARLDRAGRFGVAVVESSYLPPPASKAYELNLDLIADPYVRDPRDMAEGDVVAYGRTGPQHAKMSAPTRGDETRVD